MNCNVQPLNGYVLVMCSSTEMHGGIILPDSAKEKPRTGKVIAISKPSIDKDGSEIKHEVSVDQKVYFTKWSTTELKDIECKVTLNNNELDSKSLVLVKYSDLLLVVR